MNRQWRKVLPPLNIITALLFISYPLSYLIDLSIIRLGIPVPGATGMLRIQILVGASALYGYYRVWYFHPFYDRKYRQWLCVSPWSINKPLPQGPVHLICADLVMLAVLILLAYSNVPTLAAVPVLAFLIIYLVLIFLTFEAEQIVFPVLFLFLAPFTIYPFVNLYIAIFVLILLYVLCHVGFRQSLKDFPWNTKYWKDDIVEEFKKQAIKQKVFGWPFKFLNIYEDLEMSCFGAFILSLLLTWWLYVFVWAVNGLYDPIFLMPLAINAAFLRAAAYIGFYHPPISLLGRIFADWLIIPRYDKVFIAPICILLVGKYLPIILQRCGLSTVWNFEICSFLIFFLAFSLPPKLKNWRLTGAHRIAKFVQSIRPKPPNPLGQLMYDFFSAKFKSKK